MGEQNKVAGKSTRNINISNFYHEICRLIEEARIKVASTVNAGITMLYWQVGKRINAEILKGKRAGYGEEIVSTLSKQLTWPHFLHVTNICIEHNFLLTYLTNRYILNKAYPPSLCSACSIMAGFSFLKWRPK